MDSLHVERIGAPPGERADDRAPVFVLLHGMGLHGSVWAPMARSLVALTGGSVIAPDLRGHGRSPWWASYSYGQHAADVAALLDDDSPTYLVGHSMGGAIALALASDLFGVRPRGVFAFSTKVGFTAAELERLAVVAKAPVKLFDTERDAALRFLKVGGLEGLVAPDSAMALAGVSREGDRFRLAADIRTVLAASGRSLGALAAGATCPVVFACGENDAMVKPEDISTLGAGITARVIPAAGHNAQVEQPDLMARLVADWATSLRHDA